MKKEREEEIAERLFVYLRTGQSSADLVDSTNITQQEVIETVNRIEKKYREK